MQEIFNSERIQVGKITSLAIENEQEGIIYIIATCMNEINLHRPCTYRIKYTHFQEES